MVILLVLAYVGPICAREIDWFHAQSEFVQWSPKLLPDLFTEAIQVHLIVR